MSNKLKEVAVKVKYVDSKGCEILDPTPCSLPVGFERPLSIQEQLRRLIRHEVSQKAVMDGQESFEEADDFDCGDNDPSSPYEEQFEHNANLEELKGLVQKHNQRIAEIRAKHASQTPSPDAPKKKLKKKAQ